VAVFAVDLDSSKLQKELIHYDMDWTTLGDGCPDPNSAKRDYHQANSNHGENRLV
jgi:hypothetical protein